MEITKEQAIKIIKAMHKIIGKSYYKAACKLSGLQENQEPGINQVLKAILPEEEENEN